jgi:ferredoxin
VLGAWLSTILLRLATTRQAAALPRRLTERMAGRVRGRQVLVNVDPMRCARFGFCEQEAPDIFQLRGDGRLTYQPTVPAGRLEQAIQAARVCPARAIALHRAATSTMLPADLPVREGTG